jgi:hypothetical protein
MSSSYYHALVRRSAENGWRPCNEMLVEIRSTTLSKLSSRKWIRRSSVSESIYNKDDQLVFDKENCTFF